MTDEPEEWRAVVDGLRFELAVLVMAAPVPERAGADALRVLLRRVELPRSARRFR